MFNNHQLIITAFFCVYSLMYIQRRDSDYRGFPKLGIPFRDPDNRDYSNLGSYWGHIGVPLFRETAIHTDTIQDPLKRIPPQKYRSLLVLHRGN